MQNAFPNTVIIIIIIIIIAIIIIHFMAKHWVVQEILPWNQSRRKMHWLAVALTVN